VEERHLPNQKILDTRFSKMCELYIANHAKVNKRTWEDDDRIAKKLQKFFGDVPLMTINPDDIERYKGSRRGLVKEATINRELTILKCIFSKAVTWGYARHDPTKGVRLYKEERVPVKILLPQERKRLFEAAPDSLRPILVMALKTGMRKGEILNLKWKDINLEHGTISVTHTKSKKLREVPMHAEVEEYLKAMPRISEFVFCNANGRKLRPEGISRREFEATKTKAGLPELTFHALRHNFATELVAKGADLRTVQDYMGHSSLSLLQRYAHVSKGIWRSTIQLLGRDTTPAQVQAQATSTPIATESAETCVEALR